MELKRRQPILAGHQNFLFGDGSVSQRGGESGLMSNGGYLIRSWL
jgi:prepilin-type processing-associated H-X9-DG protein